MTWQQTPFRETHDRFRGQGQVQNHSPDSGGKVDSWFWHMSRVDVHTGERPAAGERARCRWMGPLQVNGTAAGERDRCRWTGPLQVNSSLPGG